MTAAFSARLRRASARSLTGATVTAMLLVLGALIVYPLGVTVWRVFQQGGQGVEQLGRLMASGVVPTVLANTAVVILASTALALFVGALFAWINERTDAELGPVGEMLPLAPLLVPPIAGVIGWAVLLDPRAGLVNAWLRAGLGQLGIEVGAGPINIYTVGGLIGATALYLVPYVYLVVSAALSRIDPAMEEASRVSRAGPLRTLVRITLPAIAPALAAAALLTVIAGLGLFSVPYVIGTSARIEVLSVYLFRLFDTFPPQTGLALVLAGLMVAVVQALLVLQRLLLPPGRAAAIGGKGFRGARVALGRWRPVARAAAIAYLAATSILPVLGLLLVSLQPFWTPFVQWERLSLTNYRAVLFDNNLTSRALTTSLTLAVVVATATMLVAALVMLRVQTARGSGRRLADAVTALPATLPHTVVGISFLLAFSQPPLRLYGTVFVVLFAYVVMALPFAARAASAAASSIGNELAEASRVFGAPEGRTMRRILLPLALPGLAAGWVMVFILTVGEVTASAFLASSRTPVIGRVLMDLWNYGSFPQVAALALIMTAVNAIFVGAMLRWTRQTARAALA